MRDMKTTVMGNVASDVREKVYPDGQVSATIRLAVTTRYFDRATRDYADRKTEFINVYTRRSLARNALASIQKGQPLIVTGRLGSQEWTDENGEKRFSLSIQADAVGHDLTFGRSVFAKPERFGEAPDVDERTGEVLEARSGTSEEEVLEDHEEGELVGSGSGASPF